MFFIFFLVLFCFAFGLLSFFISLFEKNNFLQVHVLSLEKIKNAAYQIPMRQRAKKKTKLNKKKKNRALPGNRTRVARMGILHDTTTLAVLAQMKCLTRSLIPWVKGGILP